MQGPFEVTENSIFQPNNPALYYQPFSTTDLLNWKQHTPSYSEKPQAMIDLLESTFQTHQPTWDDCRQLLLTFFNTEEQRQILLDLDTRYLEFAKPLYKDTAGSSKDLLKWGSKQQKAFRETKRLDQCPSIKTTGCDTGL